MSWYWAAALSAEGSNFRIVVPKGSRIVGARHEFAGARARCLYQQWAW